MTAKKALGRGLEALIPRGAAARAEVQQLPVAALKPNPRQPRRRLDEEAIKELAASVAEHGIIQPLVVRAAGPGYEVVAGERRLLAARAAGLKTVPCLVRDVADDMLLPLALVENLQREDLNAVEEARAFAALAGEFGFTHAEIAKAVGKSRVAVTNALRLLELPAAVLEMLESGELTAGQARPLVSVNPRSRQLALARRIARRGLSARRAEAAAAGGKPKAGRRPSKTRLYLDELARELEEKLGTKVRLTGTGRRGVMHVYYFSAEDLERLARRVGAGER